MQTKFRLSEEQLIDLANCNDTRSERTRFVAREAAHELRERRRADLTNEEVAELIVLRNAVVDEKARNALGAERQRCCVALLDRLIALTNRFYDAEAVGRS